MGATKGNKYRAPMSDYMFLSAGNSLRPLTSVRENRLPLPSRSAPYCRHSAPVTTAEVACFGPETYSG